VRHPPVAAKPKHNPLSYLQLLFFLPHGERVDGGGPGKSAGDGERERAEENKAFVAVARGPDGGDQQAGRGRSTYQRLSDKSAAKRGPVHTSFR
jgi:hypothetical protein